MAALLALVRLLLFDVLFLTVLLILLTLIAKRKRAAFAVLKRNFLGYFSNPTGYVFLCLFVLLTSMAAFWPNQFFASNLANLDELNRWFPIIMLFFIPAITMSIWAEEKRQGTDELLLTLPADDFDIVSGKYLSAAAIYTTSLIFSQISTFLVLVFLTMGDVDTGLFCANYLGYWFIGLAMLAIGMIASFLTQNLTVGFILGALFNAPLAFASSAEVISPSRSVARLINNFSLSERFGDFGRGVLSVSSIVYFVLIAIFGLYLCMVLIGRRNWSGGKDGNRMFFHYFSRVILFALFAFFVSLFFQNKDVVRLDATEGQVSSISKTTRKMIRELDTSDRATVIEAYLSADVPELYARTKYNIISMLKEFESAASRAGKNVQVRIYDNLEPFDDETTLAEEKYGITPQIVRVRERGTYKDQEVLLGAVVRSGLEKVVVPFFESGIPVEYELIRSLQTVSRSSRKKLGVVRTDAQLMGGFNQSTFQQIPKQAIITELAKQYEVTEIDPSSPISVDQYDVMLVVQPSSLPPEQLANLVEAVKKGVPTAVFEDPMPVMFSFPGTGEPKQPQGGMFGQQPPQPKGDIRTLWEALGIDSPGKPAIMSGGIQPEIVWQDYNPYPVLRDMQQASSAWVFVREGIPGATEVLSDASEITNGMREIMLLFCGSIYGVEDGPTDVEVLATTGPISGRMDYERVNETLRTSNSMQAVELLRGSPLGEQIVAVRVRGKDANSGSGSESSRPVDAVYVADADCFHETFLNIRNAPEQFEDVKFQMQNVTFVLNIIDVLAGENDFAAVRRHEPQFSTLRKVEEQAEIARNIASENNREFNAEFDQKKQEAESSLQKAVEDFQSRVQKLQEDGATDSTKQRQLIEALQQLQLKEQREQRKLEIELERLEEQRDQNIRKAVDEADSKIRKIQNYYKMLAVFIPPVPPLLVGIIVFVSRRLKEREGISKNRLR